MVAVRTVEHRVLLGRLALFGHDVRQRMFLGCWRQLLRIPFINRLNSRLLHHFLLDFFDEGVFVKLGQRRFRLRIDNKRFNNRLRLWPRSFFSLA